MLISKQNPIRAPAATKIRYFSDRHLGEPFAAEEAHELGLVNAVIPEAELLAVAMAKAAELAAKPRAALLATRRLMRGDAEAVKARMGEEMHAFAEALKSDEARAAFETFLAAGRK